MAEVTKLIHKYLRHEKKFPHVWCPGCGIGTAFSSCLLAVQASGFDLNKTVMVSGIGCSSRLTGYVDFNTLHTTHGRPLAFATGVKLAKPSLTTIVVTGDGDALAIGNLGMLYVRGQGVKENKVAGVALLLVSATLDPSPENHAKRNLTATRGLTTQMIAEAQALSEELSSAKNLLVPLDRYLKKSENSTGKK